MNINYIKLLDQWKEYTMKKSEYHINQCWICPYCDTVYAYFIRACRCQSRKKTKITSIATWPTTSINFAADSDLVVVQEMINDTIIN